MNLYKTYGFHGYGELSEEGVGVLEHSVITQTTTKKHKFFSEFLFSSSSFFSP
jgi:hypothetical protein